MYITSDTLRRQANPWRKYFPKHHFEERLTNCIVMYSNGSPFPPTMYSSRIRTVCASKVGVLLGTTAAANDLLSGRRCPVLMIIYLSAKGRVGVCYNCSSTTRRNAMPSANTFRFSALGMFHSHVNPRFFLWREHGLASWQFGERLLLLYTIQTQQAVSFYEYRHQPTTELHLSECIFIINVFYMYR